MLSINASAARRQTSRKPDGRPQYEVADIFREYMDDYRAEYNLSYEQVKVVNAILKCRTAALGGHIHVCDACGEIDICYCSCKNRHCPKCGSFEKAQWLAKQERLWLPIDYYHTVFTTDHLINDLARVNKEVMYNLLFDTANRVLKRFARKYYGGEMGVTMVLHTWGQRMQEHIHVHCIVTGGALVRGAEGRYHWQATPENWLFPVEELSEAFRNAFCRGLRKLWQQGQLQFIGKCKELDVKRMTARMRAKKWEVFIKPPVVGVEKLHEYLGRYVHRIAIGNYRILDVSQGYVSFYYYDNEDDGKEKIKRLRAVEFIRRFLLHVLPDHFVRIRYYGLHHSSARGKLRQVRALLGLESKLPEAPKLNLAEWVQSFTDKDPLLCPKCERGRMVRERDFGPVPAWRVTLLSTLLGLSRRWGLAY